MVEEGKDMEIPERRSSRTKIAKRVFEIESNGCSTTNSKPTSGVMMKGGAPSGAASEYPTFYILTVINLDVLEISFYLVN